MAKNISPNHQSQHVAVLAFPFACHPGLLLGLVARLAKAAPNVTFSFYNTSKSNASLLSSPSSNYGDDNIRFYDVPDGVPEGYTFAGSPEEEVNLFLEAAPQNMRKAVEAAQNDIGRKVSCVVADAFLWFLAEMAEEYGVPWLPVWIPAAHSLSVHVYTEHIRRTVGVIDGLGDSAGRQDEVVGFIPGLPEVRLGDLPSGVISGNLESPFSVMPYKMGQMLPRAKALVLNSFEELDPNAVEDLKSKFKNVLNVGPLNLTSPPPASSSVLDVHGCIPWLDKQEKGSVAYIAFGTKATPTPRELKELGEALEESNVPFIWSLRDNFKDSLPDGFLERTGGIGKMVPWAPQLQVLGHESVGVFISHFGMNSVLESIAAGVPTIGRPFLGDNALNAWMVEKVWQIGLRIEGDIFKKEAIFRALDMVLSEEKGKTLKERILPYKELALKAVGPNGSSTKNFGILVDIITKGNPSRGKEQVLRLDPKHIKSLRYKVRHKE